MRKQVFIINGQGGVGKDTICNCAAQHFRVRNVSSITPIVEIARFAGWDGQKTLAARRLLSQLKRHYGNRSDDEVESYPYDLYFDNHPPLDTLPERVRNFFEKL